MKIIEFLKEVVIGVLYIGLGSCAVVLVMFGAIQVMHWALQQGWELIIFLVLVSAVAGVIMGAITGRNLID